MRRSFYPSDEYDSIELERALEARRRRYRLSRWSARRRDDDDDPPPSPMPARSPRPRSPLGLAAQAA